MVFFSVENETELFIIGHQMSNPIITGRLIAFDKCLMFAASVLISMTSGNDKAPFLVLGTLALNLAVMLFYGICIVAAGQRTYKLHITVNFATLFYAVAVILPHGKDGSIHLVSGIALTPPTRDGEKGDGPI